MKAFIVTLVAFAGVVTATYTDQAQAQRFCTFNVRQGTSGLLNVVRSLLGQSGASFSGVGPTDDIATRRAVRDCLNAVKKSGATAYSYICLEDSKYPNCGSI